MAPTDAANALLSNRSRPSMIRPIVPAIPLPYMQKRKQTAAASKKFEEVPVAKSSAETLSTITSSADLSTIEPSNTERGTNESTAITPVTPINPATQEIVGMETSDVQENVAGPSMTGGLEILSPPSPPFLTYHLTDRSITEEVKQTPYVVTPDEQSLEPQSTYSMPPPFVPANRASAAQPNATMTDDAVKLPSQPPFGSQHPIHNAHPSAGSLMFGGCTESTNSSPAPPLSASGSQQQPSQTHIDNTCGYPPQYANGGHLHNISNGYSPLSPPGPGYYPRPDGHMNHNPGPDYLSRRHMINFGPAEGYSPSGTPVGAENQRFTPHDPATPHSFHGSQSSLPNEYELSGPHNPIQYSAAIISKGSNGHVDDIRLYQHPRPKGQGTAQSVHQSQHNHMPQNMVQPQMLPSMDNLDGLVEYIQSQFAEPQFADYTLELRYSDDRAAPVRIPGHNLIFARSPTLKGLMVAQAPSNSDGLTSRTLFMESNDRFLRSDGFWMAVQRLYGGPLLDPGASAAATIPPASHLSPTMPGTAADRFEIALGYAAAGHLLKMPPVVERGIDIASHFVSWSTLEKALDFALDGGLDAQWTLGNSRYSGSESTYGPAVNMLLSSAMNFIITAFPPNFELDTSVAQPNYNHRLPFIPSNRPSLPNPRLSSIKFGDHLSEDSVRSSTSSTTNCALSKILLNLPFPLLKHVLESSRLGNVHGWATTALRTKVMHAVIEEREKRRNATRESKNVSDDERKANPKQWDAVGWQESLGPPYGGSETPTLTRTWVDFMLSGIR